MRFVVEIAAAVRDAAVLGLVLAVGYGWLSHLLEGALRHAGG